MYEKSGLLLYAYSDRCPSWYAILIKMSSIKKKTRMIAGLESTLIETVVIINEENGLSRIIKMYIFSSILD